MNKNLRTMCESIQMFNQGKFDSVDLDVQIEAGWVDWFCRDSSLRAKTKKLYQKIKQIADSKKFDKNKVYVLLKNNCPMNGILYDSFSIVDIETDDVLFWITPSNGCSNSRGWSEVYGKNENDFEDPLNSQPGKWKDVVKFFMN